MKVYTDNVVVGYPVRNLGFDHGEPEFFDICDIFSRMQASLASEGFFVRGAIAFGDLYMDEDIVFGEALLEAVALDKSGTGPRIVFGKSALSLVERQLGFYGNRAKPYHNEVVLRDGDGAIFINYLSEAYSAFPEGGVFFHLIEGHKRHIEERLARYHNDARIMAKYEWAARYHNYVCRTFAERHRPPQTDEWDEYVSACEQAQQLVDYLIEIEGQEEEPRVAFASGEIRQ